MPYKDPYDERARAARRRHYEKNKQVYHDNARRREAEMRQYVVDIKNSGSCLSCGVSYPDEPWLMEFDHRDQADKVGIISQLVKRGSWQKLKDEIAKCDLVCVLCHRRRTAIQLGWTTANKEVIE